MLGSLNGDWEKDFARYIRLTEGLCRATHFEQHELWHEWSVVYGYSWEQEMGYGESIGTINKYPLMLTISFVRVQSRMIGFYDCTGWVADWNMVNAWIKKKFPGVPKAFDAMNIHNLFHHDLNMPRPDDMEERSKKYRKVEQELIWSARSR